MKLLLLLAVVLLTGCTTLEERMVGYQESCRTTYGFDPDSDAFRTCVLEMELAYQNAASQVIVIPQVVPIVTSPPPAMPPVWSWP